MGAMWNCWKCGATIAEPAGNMPRMAQCRQCGADLHVCRMCRYYNPKISGRCDNELAEPARDTETANFCGYLEILPQANLRYTSTNAIDAAAKLAALFGDDNTTPHSSPKDPEEKLRALLKEKERN